MTEDRNINGHYFLYVITDVKNLGSGTAGSEPMEVVSGLHCLASR